MSKPFLSSDILYTQRFLAFCGYYMGKLDGIHGPKTEHATFQFDNEYRYIKKNIGELDPRSEANLYTLAPQCQIAARMFMVVYYRDFVGGLSNDAPSVRIISGTRSYEEQNRLYSIGRYKDHRARVTNARGGQSNHNFGIAFDIGIFRQGTYITSVPDYIDVGKKLSPKIDSLEWGGNWTSFKDYPHYQLKTGKSVHVIRQMFERGEKLNL